MKKPDRLKFGAAMGMALALVFYAGTGAWAQLDTDLPGGHLKIQTALETDWGVSTAGKPNRNNDNNHVPGSGQGLSTDGNDLQSANGRIEPLTTFRASDDTAQAMWLDNADVYVHLRFWGDVAQLINGPHVNTVGQGDYTTPGVSRYPGDAWAARVSEHEYEADAAEAYIDLRKGPFSLRLGKQQVVYGEELGLQTLDQVDSLDFTRWLQGFQIASLEFSDVRIAEWTAKGSYQLPDFSEVGVNNSVITGFVSPDFQPSYFVGNGSQVNDVPVFERIGDYGNIRRARNKIVYGTVASTTVYDVDLTANFYSTPDHIGWFSTAPVKNPFPIDTFSGSPFLGPAAGPRDFLLQRRFSREFIYGGSASYTIPALDFPGSSLLYGDIFHFSAAYTPRKSFTGNSTGVNRQSQENRRDQCDSGRRTISSLERKVPLDVSARGVQLQKPQRRDQRDLHAVAGPSQLQRRRFVPDATIAQRHLDGWLHGCVRHELRRQLVLAACDHLQTEVQPGVQRLLEFR